MTRWLLVAFSIAACGGARSESAGRAPAPPPAPVSIPEPVAEDAAAPVEPAPAPSEQPAAASADAGKQSFSSDDLSPPVEARGAIVVDSGMHSGRHLLLLRVPARREHCNEPRGGADAILQSCEYKVGSCSSGFFTVLRGTATSYKVRVVVLKAPAGKGARGKARIEESDDTNVTGGEIDVLVCD